MRHFQPFFRTGRHLAAARTLAGLKQSELADLAGLHVNSLKRLEAMKGIFGSEHAANRVGEALKAEGVLAVNSPSMLVQFIETPVREV